MADEEKRARKGISGFLSGMAELVEKLEAVAEQGGELSRTGSFEAPKHEDSSKAMKGIYGFSVKLGLGGKEFKVEPFGNLRQDRSTKEPVMEEVREPLVDVFDEEDRLLVVAEMPGIEAEDVHVDLQDRSLTLRAERGDRKYQKSLEVPETVQRDRLSINCKNGIIEISCEKR